MKRNSEHIFKIIGALLLLLILYLIALNGRYEEINGSVFDKWRNKVYLVGSDEIPVVRNGEDIYDASR